MLLKTALLLLSVHLNSEHILYLIFHMCQYSSVFFGNSTKIKYEKVCICSYERQGLDKIPTVHMGPAVSQMEKRGIQTNIGNLNRDITAANRDIL